MNFYILSVTHGRVRALACAGGLAIIRTRRGTCADEDRHTSRPVPMRSIDPSLEASGPALRGGSTPIRPMARDDLLADEGPEGADPGRPIGGSRLLEELGGRGNRQGGEIPAGRPRLISPILLQME